MYLSGLGTAVPPRRFTQVECWEALQQAPQFSELNARSRALLTACRAINRDVGAANAALDRVVAKRRPSHKKEVKDSYILEHCLVVARELGGTTFQKRMLFVSSNTKDFADPGSTAVHTDLASDFATAGLGFAGTIAIAVEQLRAASQIP